MGNSGGKKKASGETSSSPTKHTTPKNEDKAPKPDSPRAPAPKASEETPVPKKTEDKGSEKPKNKTAAPKDEGSKKIEKFFDSYKDPEYDGEGEAITMEGVVKLFEDLNVDPEDPTVLVLAYHMNAKEAATFTKTEFETGCKKLGVDSLQSLKAKWSTFKTTLSTPATFKDVYKFTFNYMKEDPGHKTVNLEISKAYLLLLIGDRPHVASFVTYLDHQTTYKGLNLDQWMTLLDFVTNVKEDLSNYDEDGAWPVVLDSFVDWKRRQLAEAAAGTEANGSSAPAS